jgi:hypothetical protein
MLAKGDKVKLKPEVIARYVGLRDRADETGEVMKVSTSKGTQLGKPVEAVEVLVRLHDVLYMVSPEDCVPV